jgi:hypothetical protein
MIVQITIRNTSEGFFVGPGEKSSVEEENEWVSFVHWGINLAQGFGAACILGGRFVIGGLHR